MNKEEILKITKKFHDTYEKLSKEYNYETREDTKVFDINSNNGKLMYVTVNEIVSPILKENKQLKNNWNKLKKYIKTEIPEDAFIDTEWFVSILDKMQELEQGSDSNDRPKTR